MKKKIFFSGSVLTLAAFFSFAFTTSKEHKALPCLKTFYTNSCGIVYYGCSTSGGFQSPDCYVVPGGTPNGTCNVTRIPGCGGL